MLSVKVNMTSPLPPMRSLLSLPSCSSQAMRHCLDVHSTGNKKMMFTTWPFLAA